MAAWQRRSRDKLHVTLDVHGGWTQETLVTKLHYGAVLQEKELLESTQSLKEKHLRRRWLLSVNRSWCFWVGVCCQFTVSRHHVFPVLIFKQEVVGSKHQNSPETLETLPIMSKVFEGRRTLVLPRSDTHLGRWPPSGTYSAALKQEKDQSFVDRMLRVGSGRVGGQGRCSGLYSPSRSSVVLMAAAGRSFTDRQGVSSVSTSSSKPQWWREADVKAPVSRCENMFVCSLLLTLNSSRLIPLNRILLTSADAEDPLGDQPDPIETHERSLA